MTLFLREIEEMMTGIEFNLPTRNSKFAVKDVSTSERFEYEIYSLDTVLVRGGHHVVQTSINYRFNGNRQADVFSAVIKSNGVDYELRPGHYKLLPSGSFKTLTVDVYSVTRQDMKLPTDAPLAKIIVY